MSRARFHGRYANMAIVLQRILIIIWALGVLRFGSLCADQLSPASNPPASAARQSSETGQLSRQQRMLERNKFSVQARLLESAGKLDEAIAAAEQMLAIEREVLGSDHPDAIASLRRLALMHQEKGDFAAGRQFDEQVLAATTKCLGKDHWQSINAQRALETVALLEKLPVADRDQYLRAVALDRNAQALHAMHDVSAAIAPALEATEVYRRVFGDMHLEYGNSLNALANLYAERGEYSKAEPLYRQAVQISKSALGERHPYYATRLDNLGSIDRLAGDDAKAEPLLREALKIRKEALGEKHPDYIATLDRLADVCGANGDFAEARKLDVELLAEMTRRLGKDHWQTVNVRKAMERMAFLEQQSPEGQQSYLRAGGLARCKKTG